MKPLLLFPILLLAGLGVGGGAAFGVHAMVPAAPAASDHTLQPLATTFTPAGKVLAPLVYPDGRLAGYVLIDVQIETSAEDAELVVPRLPLLLNAINMRTFRTPMASGPDGTLPDLNIFRKIVLESATEAFGPHVVSRAVIIQAAPA